MRNAAGLLEMTPMAKFEVSGPRRGGLARAHPREPPAPRARAHRALPPADREGHGAKRVHGDPASAKTSSTWWARRAARRHDLRRALARPAPATGSVRLRNASAERGCFTVVGPQAREVLQPIAEGDLGNDALPWLRARTMTVGFASDVRVLRIDYEGELGYELYHPIGHPARAPRRAPRRGRGAGPAPRRLPGDRVAAPRQVLPAPCTGTLDVEHSALEAGLERFLKLDGNRDFTGRAALERQRAAGLERRMVTLEGRHQGRRRLHERGRLRERRRSRWWGASPPGAYSHTLGHSISMAYVGIEHSRPGTALEIPAPRRAPARDGDRRLPLRSRPQPAPANVVRY